MEEHEKNGYVSMAARLRIDVIEATNACKSGHPTSCASLADIITIIFFHPIGMKYHPAEPLHLDNDKVILSKGHAAPILYAVWSEIGLVHPTELRKLRRIDSDLEGHPTPRLPFIDVATGSLGQGLSAGCGMAYSIKYFEKKPNKVFVLLGDGECAEGSVWEAMNFAQFYNLNNLIAIVDINSLGQTYETMLGHDIKNYKDRFDAFSWNTICIDGHDLDQIVEAIAKARQSDKPVAILARTVKGKDMLVAENKFGWHGKPIGIDSEEVIKYLKTKVIPNQTFPDNLPEAGQVQNNVERGPIVVTPPEPLTALATRMAFGKAVASLSSNEDIVVLDCDTRGSTGTELFYNECPERFIECFIAEQNMVGVALGVSKRNKIAFACCFGVFMSRSFDQIRLSNISNGNIKFVGSHAGVSIGEDGPTHMALEDLALFRSLPGALVLYPCDTLSTYKAVEVAANFKGVVYIKTSRPAWPVIHTDWLGFDEEMNVILSTDQDKACIFAAGVTTHESLKAAKALAQEGIHIRVVDMFRMSQLNFEKLAKNTQESGNVVLTVEDHYISGGIFESVAASIGYLGARVHGLYIKELPRSGKSEELLEMYGIDSNSIQAKIRSILNLVN